MKKLERAVIPRAETAAIRLADEEQELPYHLDTLHWTLTFLQLCANNPEGIASDYCEQYA